MNFIPIFPLSVAPYPGKTMALNIFEEQYIQLINDCISQRKAFGIPLIVKGETSPIGMMVTVIEVKEKFADGKMYITIRGEKVFHLIETIDSLPDKMYKGAVVKYPQNDMRGLPALLEKVLILLERMYALSKMYYPIESNVHNIKSYDIADFMAFTLDQKIEFLSLLKETERLEYMRRHLNEILPVIENSAILSNDIQGKDFGLDSFSLN